MATANFIIISYDKMHSELMTAFDVFEKGKVLGTIKEVAMTLSDGDSSISKEPYDGRTIKRATAILSEYDRCKKIIDTTKETLEKNGELVSLIHLKSFQTGDIILTNSKLQCPPYINKEVRIISDGHKFGMFHEFLKKIGIQVELTQDCFIKNVIIPEDENN